MTAFVFFFFQAEDGIRVFCLSRGLGVVYKIQPGSPAGFVVIIRSVMCGIAVSTACTRSAVNTALSALSRACSGRDGGEAGVCRDVPSLMLP